MQSVLLISALIFLVESGTSYLHGSEVRVVGEHIYGPETAEKTACNLAEQKAKAKAVASASGEIISSEQTLICEEARDEANCQLNSAVWSNVVGLLKSSRRINKTIQNPGSEQKTCKVTVMAEVSKGSGKRDPSFDFTVKLGRKDNTYREGDSITFTVFPRQKMYITIFLWRPYISSERPITRIFPNLHDTKNHFHSRGTVPTKNSKEPYAFEVDLADVPQGKKLVDEYLMFVGTRKNVKFLERHTLETLNLKLLEIPLSDWRRKRKALYLLRGKLQNK